jgi:LPS export ABC transporter protein LptC
VITPPPHRSIRGTPLWLGLGVVVLLSGCSGELSRTTAESGATPFVFRALNLRQQDLLGRPTWTLTSPEARYDIDSRIARSTEPRGTIFRDGQPAYRLSADSGIVVNDGALVLLEGDIRLEQLGAQPLLIQARRARWLPARNLLELDHRPEAFDGSNRITARRARYLFDQEELRLLNAPRVEHWSQRIDPFHPQKRGKPEIVLQVRSASWFPRSGRLESNGPLRAWRLAPAAPQTTAANLKSSDQTLTAAALFGNTREQRFTLTGPVKLLDPSQDLTLLARQISIDLPARVIRTTMPATEQPSGLPADAGCLVRQRGDSLQARQCQWNWDSQIVIAQGAVQLRRQDHQQLTRGSLLIGTLGAEGRFRLSNPGGRVISRFAAPARPAQAPAPPRPAPEPIRL